MLVRKCYTPETLTRFSRNYVFEIDVQDFSKITGPMIDFKFYTRLQYMCIEYKSWILWKIRN